ncbi:amidase family protein [Stylonychia lemnae]|uniref:Amidase family protein n=1 Tax=Stylonychia lemnae TaxID=5949 RepID=A0A078AMH1_STYLE|nr:amidase family protein [Stylonychia lemnae]|eukprot:CDW83580.1 amidase family protein [Stylonychia lemnae]
MEKLLQLVDGSYFANKCYFIGRRLRLNAEECFDEAIEETRKKDKEREETMRNEKIIFFLCFMAFPLLSKIWQSIRLYLLFLALTKGKRTTVGTQFMMDNLLEENDTIVKVLKQQGAIILVKGSIPQGAGSYHTDNRLWGRALNPYDQERSCGGSSGSDAALFASRCIPNSFGTDLRGGSLRVPNHLTEFFALTQLPGESALNGKFEIGHCFGLPAIEANLSMQRGIRLTKQSLQQRVISWIDRSCQFKGEKRFLEQVSISTRRCIKVERTQYQGFDYSYLCNSAFKHASIGKVGGFNDYLNAFTITQYPI